MLEVDSDMNVGGAKTSQNYVKVAEDKGRIYVGGNDWTCLLDQYLAAWIRYVAEEYGNHPHLLLANPVRERSRGRKGGFTDGVLGEAAKNRLASLNQETINGMRSVALIYRRRCDWKTGRDGCPSNTHIANVTGYADSTKTPLLWRDLLVVTGWLEQTGFGSKSVTGRGTTATYRLSVPYALIDKDARQALGEGDFLGDAYLKEVVQRLIKAIDMDNSCAVEIDSGEDDSEDTPW